MMGKTSASFNLVDKPWIGARTLEGNHVELSIREVFHRSSQLQSLSNDIATQDFAILRLLVAVVERSINPLLDEYEDEDIGPAGAWGSFWRDGLPLEYIDSYLDEWHDRFDLLDAEKPFMQVADLVLAETEASSKKRESKLRSLIVDVPNRAERALFSSRTGGGLESLSLSEAARWLVHAHAFDTGGNKTGDSRDPSCNNGKSNAKGAGWAGRIGGVCLEGHNLAETILLNLVLYSNRSDFGSFVSPDDLPAWEQPQKTPGDDGRLPNGPADLYTWQSRRVRLIIEDDKLVDVVFQRRYRRSG